MSRLNIAPIVEGHGDNSAVRLLVQNLWGFLGGEYCNVLTPIRRSRGKLLKSDDPDLGKAINLALMKLNAVGGGMVLILIDAEEDCAKHGSLGPLILKRAMRIRPDADIACVIANVMFETWFVACAEKMVDCLFLADGEQVPADPEGVRAGKGWIKNACMVKDTVKRWTSPDLHQGSILRCAASDRHCLTSYAGNCKSGLCALNDVIDACVLRDS